MRKAMAAWCQGLRARILPAARTAASRCPDASAFQPAASVAASDAGAGAAAGRSRTWADGADVAAMAAASAAKTWINRAIVLI